MRNISFHKPPALPTILMLIGVLILCMLGMWQVKRLAWKTGLITEYNAAKTSNRPIDFNALEGNPLFLGGTVSAITLNDKNVYEISPRTFDGDVGKHIYMPLKLPSGRYIFANLGWVKMDKDYIAPQILPDNINAIIKRVEVPNAFTPDNRSGSWVWPDLKSMAEDAQLQNVMTSHYAILQTSLDDTIKPIGESERPPFKNDHLQYAVFWFAMAGILIVIFALRFVVVMADGRGNNSDVDAT